MAATDRQTSLRGRVAAAVCSLLGIPPAVQAAARASDPPPSADQWSWDASFMRYSEVSRISVLEPQASVRRDFSDHRSLSVLVTVDTISGATPLGTLPATANTAPDAVTSASGRGINPVIGKIPTSQMTDTRYAIDGSWQQPLASDYTGILGANVSKESDFLAVGADTKLARDFNEKNTTLSLGLAPEYDVSSPNGGLPLAYGTEFTPGTIIGNQDTKWLLAGQAGLTQVINRRMLMQFNYGLTHEQGYLNDPYKLLSLVNADGDPVSAIFEKRPGRRTEQYVYWLTRYNIWDQDIASLALRFYSDNWGIRSQTMDFTFRRQSTERFYWEPHVRYYHQSAADFYHVGLLQGAALPEFASADQRLAEFIGITFGVRFGYAFRNGSLLVVRAEFYSQSGESFPKEAVGAQHAFDLFPTLNASIVQVDYSFDPGRWFKGDRLP
ncbi:MAG TPA: DUF3570 domain-containing protein [Elusimicrobiota bacterium]|nr:DUF3570 domain-containing protein [Elusimicrobiota bacterium]